MTFVSSTAIIAGGSRLLGGLAVPAARALARKVTFRWRIGWRVRKRVKTQLSWHAYRAWLASISIEELAGPTQQTHPHLAKRLDEYLTRGSKDWSSREDHLSRALQLVEHTFPAIAATLGDGDRTELCERWARQRDTDVRDLLAQLVPADSGLSSADLADILMSRSSARRAVRLQAFEVQESVLHDQFDNIEVIDVPTGEVRVLLGPFGAGKSETAEMWHRANIRLLSREDNAPFPVWLNARDLSKRNMEGLLEDACGKAWQRGRGAAIVIDGLDESDPASAESTLGDARILCKTTANISFLLTAREGILSPTKIERKNIQLLSPEMAVLLVERISGKKGIAARWSTVLQATIRRPLFGLAAGFTMAAHRTIRGDADLIRILVETSLTRGTERSALTSTQTRNVLERLAVTLTRDNGERLSFADEHAARNSRLIADGPDGSISFALPIFQHWFAAQAILSGAVNPSEPVQDYLSFGNWRWAAAVALQSGNGTRSVDDLIKSFISGNPGAAAWILREAFGADDEWRSDTGQRDQHFDAERLLKAFRTWIDSLGPLARTASPYSSADMPIGLIVEAHTWGSGTFKLVGFTKQSPSADSVTTITRKEGPTQWRHDESWDLWFGGTIYKTGAHWPWMAVRKRIAERLRRELTVASIIGAPDGIWVQERRFDLGRRLIGGDTLSFKEMAIDELVNAARSLRDESTTSSTGRLPSKDLDSFSTAELDEYIEWLTSSNQEYLYSGLPKADVTPGRDGARASEHYSTIRLMEFEAEVYSRACAAYDEALEYAFSKFAWSMSLSALSPFGVILELDRNDYGRPGRRPIVTSILVPMGLLPELAKAAPGAIWSENGRAVISSVPAGSGSDVTRYRATLERIRCWLALQGREPMGGLIWTSTSAEDMLNPRPGSYVAAGWILSDLKNIGLL